MGREEMEKVVMKQQCFFSPVEKTNEHDKRMREMTMEF